MPGVVVTNPVSSILYDELGNKVGIVLDGILYRLQVEAKLATGHGLSTELTVSGILAELQQKTEPSDTQIVGDGGNSLSVDDNGSSLSIDDGSGSITVDNNGTFLVQATQSGTWNINNITGTVSLPTGAATEATVAGLLTESTFTTRINTQGQKTMSASTPVTIAGDQSDMDVLVKDASGLNFLYHQGDVVSGVNVPGPIIHGISQHREVLAAYVSYDAADGIRRLAIDGKVSISPPPPPAGTTEVIMSADNPLSMNGTHNTEYIIGTGKTFHIQQITCGAEGDPNEKGSKVEIIFHNGTEHIVERIYVVGFTQFGIYPDTAEARDGTKLIGNGTNKIIIRRNRLGGNTLEVDAVVRGYEQ